jgi:hypothetical protein
MYFSAAASLENDQGSMDFASKTHIDDADGLDAVALITMVNRKCTVLFARPSFGHLHGKANREPANRE